MTDMMMPVMDGPAAILVLRRRKPGIKIIATSGIAADHESEEAASLGVNAFLAKPFEVEKLLSTLAGLLSPSAPS
jgi:CheY-like chemotaxis protein